MTSRVLGLPLPFIMTQGDKDLSAWTFGYRVKVFLIKYSHLDSRLTGEILSTTEPKGETPALWGLADSIGSSRLFVIVPLEPFSWAAPRKRCLLYRRVPFSECFPSPPQEQLNNLMTVLRSTAPHFIRCIIPNENKAAGKISVVPSNS